MKLTKLLVTLFIIAFLNSCGSGVEVKNPGGGTTPKPTPKLHGLLQLIPTENHPFIYVATFTNDKKVSLSKFETDNPNPILLNQKSNLEASEVVLSNFIENDNQISLEAYFSNNTEVVNVHFNINESLSISNLTLEINGENIPTDFLENLKTPGQIAEGEYSVVHNQCEDEETSNIIITQSPDNPGQLTFNGGFDYNILGEDYFGSIDQEGVISFINEGGGSTANCVGTIIDGVFTGICEVTGSQAEICDFIYHDIN